MNLRCIFWIASELVLTDKWVISFQSILLWFFVVPFSCAWMTVRFHSWYFFFLPIGESMRIWRYLTSTETFLYPYFFARFLNVLPSSLRKTIFSERPDSIPDWSRIVLRIPSVTRLPLCFFLFGFAHLKSLDFVFVFDKRILIPERYSKYIPLYLYSFLLRFSNSQFGRIWTRCTASLTFGYFVQNVCRIWSRPCRRHRVHQTKTIASVQIHFLWGDCLYLKFIQFS